MTAAEALALIEYAKKEKVKLTEWQEITVKSIQRLEKLNPMYQISKQQSGIVKAIYAKATGGAEREYHKYIK